MSMEWRSFEPSMTTPIISDESGYVDSSTGENHWQTYAGHVTGGIHGL